MAESNTPQLTSSGTSNDLYTVSALALAGINGAGTLTEDSVGQSYLLNVLANDKSTTTTTKIYSIDNGLQDTVEVGKNVADLLAADKVGVSEKSLWGASISIAPDGKGIVYTFTADAQAHFNSLGAGEIGKDTFTYAVKLANGSISWSTVTIQVVGTNDVPVLTGGTAAVTAGDITEDSIRWCEFRDDDHDDGDHEGEEGEHDDADEIIRLRATGGFQFTDADRNDHHTVTTTSVGTNLGTMRAVVGDEDRGNTVKWLYSVDNTKVQYLGAGEAKVETFNVTVSDGHGGTVTQLVSVTIHGTNDAAAITGTSTGAVVEAGGVENGSLGVASASGKLTVSDVDQGQNVVANPGDQTGKYGTFTLAADGTWNYSVDQGKADPLSAGEVDTETFTVASKDGTASQNVVVTITGTNDAPVVSGTVSGNAIEDAASVTVDALGKASDIDHGAALSVVDVPAHLPAGVSYNATNHSFTLDPGHADYQHLASGATATVTVSYGVSDGSITTPASVSWTVTGINDAPTVTATLVSAADEGQAAFTVDLLSGAGDLDDNAVLGVANVSTLPSGVTLSGNMLSVDPTNAAFDHLAAGVTQEITVTYDVTDGTNSVPQSVTITITGTNDAPTVAAALTSAVAEGDSAYTVNLLTGAGDLDDGAALSVANISTLPAGVTVSGNTLSIDPTHAAFDHLAAGVKQEITVTYDVTDGTRSVPQSVTITVTGTNDGATISGTSAAALDESDDVLSASGTLSVSDIDSPETFGVQTDVAGSNGFGTFSIDANGNWTYSAGAHNEFKAGVDYTDSIVVTSTDGTASQTITVNISGSNDGATISGTSSAALTETDATLSANGKLAVSDVDSAQTFEAQTAVAGSNGYGTFSIDANGNWTYSAGAHNEFEAGVDYTDSIVVTSSDGTASQTITVTITGTNDGATISGTSAAALDESDDVLSASGTLSVSDIDSPETFGVQTDVAGSNGFGTFSIDANGNWTYSAGAHNEFEAGVDYTDSIVVTSSDGTASQTITVTITGTNDGATISGTSSAALTESDAALSASGKLAVSDVDSAQTFEAQTAVTGSNGYGSFSIDANGNWTYNAGAHNEFKDGMDYTDSIVVTSTDGTASQTITVTISGTNDAPVISALADTTGTAIEAGNLDSGTATAGTETITGVVAANDVDNGSVLHWSVLGTPSNAYGTFSIDPDTGNWTYQLDNSKPATQALWEGQAVTQTFNVRVADELGLYADQAITVTITGTNDSPVAVADTRNISENQSFTFDVVANDVDPDGEVLNNLTLAQVNSLTPNQVANLTIDDPETTPINVLWLTAVSVPAGQGSVSIDNNQLVFNPGTDFDHLANGATAQVVVTYSVTDVRGAVSTSTMTINVSGTNDGATITASASEDNSVKEDSANHTAAGQLTVADVDSGEAHFQTPASLSGNFGTFSFNAANGQWGYTLDDSKVQSLGATGSATDSLTVKSADGTASQTITVNIAGTNDDATISASSSEDTSVEQGGTNLTAGGQLTVSDLDSGEAHFQTPASLAGTYGTFTFNAVTGQWGYALGNNLPAVPGGSDTAIDSVTVTSADGTASQTISVNITFANHEAVIGAPTVASVTENQLANGSDYLVASGTISISDQDSGEALFSGVVDAQFGNIGSLVLLSNGSYTYSVPNNMVQALTTPTHVDHFTVYSVDGTHKDISFTVNTTAPSAPGINGFSDNSGATNDKLTNDTTPTLTINAEHGTTVEVFRNGVSVGTATETSIGTFTFTSQALADGNYSFTAKAVDAAGNASAVSAAQGISIDATAPEAVLRSAVRLEATDNAAGNDYSPQVGAVGTQGDYVVTWYGREGSFNGNDDSVYVQKFNANGTTAGNPVLLEATGNNYGIDFVPQIASVGTTGEYVVTWIGADSSANVSDYSIYVQKFNADGTTAGPRVLLEPSGVTGGYDYNPQITAVGTSGQYVVTWHGPDVSSNSDSSVFVQMFNANGTPTGTPVMLEAPGNTTGFDGNAQISAVGSSGGYVVTWQGQDTTGGDYSIYVQKFNANGTVAGAPVLLEATGNTTGLDNNPQINAVGTSGDFVVTWTGVDSSANGGDYSIYVQKFNANGTVAGAPVLLEATGNTTGSDGSPQISAVGTSGDFVVTWHGPDSTANGGDYSIYVQKFNANGTVAGAPVLLEATGNTTGNDSNPQISVVGANGDYVVTWSGSDSSANGYDTSIYVQKFNANGTALGGPVMLEAPGNNTGYDYSPQVAAVGTSGAFVVTWYGYDAASSGENSVFVQKFNADGSLVSNPPLITSSQAVTVQSNELGSAYLVNSAIDVHSINDITSAAGNLWNFVSIASVNTNTQLSASGLADGTYRLYTSDAAGNLSAAAAQTISIDSTAPVTPVITGISDNSGSTTDFVTNDTTPTLYITAEAGSRVEVLNNYNYSAGWATEVSAGQFVYTSPALSDSFYQFTVKSTDATGNVSASSAGIYVTVDTRAPSVLLQTTVALDTPRNSNGFDDSQQVTAVGTGGEYVVTWRGYDASANGGDSSIYVQKFNANGTPAGTPVVLETPGVTTGWENTPQVTAVGSNGEYVVAWEGPDGSANGDFSVYLQKFNANGTTAGTPVRVEAPGVTAWYDGAPQLISVGNASEFVMTWRGQEGGTNGGDVSIYVQKFDASLAAMGNAVKLEAFSNAASFDYAPQISAIGTNGEYVVTWYGEDGSANGNDYSVYVQKFSANGALIGAQVRLEATGNSTSWDYAPQVTSIGINGEYVVTWQGIDSGSNGGDYSVYVQKFNANGTTAGTPVMLEAPGNTTGYDLTPQITAVGTNGDYVVTWYGHDNNGTSGDYSVHVQKFNANGTLAGPTVTLEATGNTTGDDVNPQVTSIGANGDYLVTWVGLDSNANGNDYSIYIQKFNADGSRAGTAFLLEPSGSTTMYDDHPQIAAVGTGGDFVVTWYGQINDGTGNIAVFTQRFNANGEAVATSVNNNGSVQVQSNETGTAYLVSTAISVTSVNDILAAADNQWNSVGITAANTNTALATTGLANGSYRVYTVDVAGNVSTVSPSVVEVNSTAPTISSITGASSKSGFAGTANFAVSFSEPVFNVSASDFQLSGTAMDAANFPTITAVRGSGTTWFVTVTYDANPAAGGDQGNTLGLNLKAGSGVKDISGNVASASNFADQIASLQPAGTAGEAINLALPDPVTDGSSVVITLSGVPAGWTLSAGTDHGDGTWTVITDQPGALSVTTPSDFVGAHAMAMDMQWTNADGTVGSMHVDNNVEAYAPGSPIFALSSDDNLTASSGADTLVFAAPMAHNKVFNFDVSADKLDLIGFGVASVTELSIANDADGNAVVTMADGSTVTVVGVDAAALSDANFAFDVEPLTVNNGTITIGDGAVMPFGGDIENHGSIVLGSEGRDTELEVLFRGVDLTGGGTVVLSDNAANHIYGGTADTVLTNVDNTISGAGSLGDGLLTLVNHGSIVANGSNALVLDTGSNTIVNTGTLEASGTGGMVVNSALANDGLLLANGGELKLLGDVSGLGSALISGSGIIEFGASNTNNVAFAEGDGTLRLDDSDQFSGLVSGLNGGDTLDFNDLLSTSETTITFADNADHTGGVLTVSNGTSSSSLNLMGQYSADQFALAVDLDNSTLVKLVQKTDPLV